MAIFDPTKSTSKYAQAWAILKETKSLSLILETPRVENTIRKAIIEHKKLDKTKDPLERIKVKKYLNPEGKVVLTFKLVPCVRSIDALFDLVEPPKKENSDDESIDIFSIGPN